MDCHCLLAEYVRSGSDPAFRELVARYVDFVYSTAFRLVDGDAHRAEDVAQTVFLDLAREACTLSGEVKLGGWLHRHTCFVAAKTMRGERRRQWRERQAVEMSALQDDGTADFSRVAPVLDDAINELGDADRTAVLLRFFEQQDFRTVGAALGTNEDAARMRVMRALEKLQDLLLRRGVKTTAGALAVVLSHQVVQAAPAGLAGAIVHALALGGSSVAPVAGAVAATSAPIPVTTATANTTTAGAAAAATTTASTSHVIAMPTIHKLLVAAVLVVTSGAGIYEARQSAALRRELEVLHREAQSASSLAGERDDARRQLEAARAAAGRGAENAADLLRLRAEVTRLREELRVLKAVSGASAGAASAGTGGGAAVPGLAAAPSKPGDFFGRDQLVLAGFSSPEAAVQSLSWAMANSSYDALTNSLSPKLLQEQQATGDARKGAEMVFSIMAPRFVGMQLLARKDLAEDRVEIKVRWEFREPSTATGPVPSTPASTSQFWIQSLIRVGNEWKRGTPGRPYTPAWDADGTIHSFVQ